MHIHCSDISKPYLIHGIRKESLDGGTSIAECDISIRHTKRLMKGSQKAICIWLTDKEEDSMDNFKRFSLDTMEAIREFCMELDSHRRCVALLEHDRTCQKWRETLPLLRSRYTGEWIERQLRQMTSRIEDENTLFSLLTTHFILSEWFQRDIGSVEFSDAQGIREHQENAFAVPLTFKQTCSISQQDERQILIIDGHTDLQRDKQQTCALGKAYGIDNKSIVSIIQHTAYEAEDLSGLPLSIHSLYRINGEREPLKTVETLLTFEYDNHATGQ